MKAWKTEIEAHGNCTILDFTGHSRVVICDDEEPDRMGDFLEDMG